MSNIARKYFGTDGIRGEVGSGSLTPEFVLRLGWAAGKVLARAGIKNKVVIGKDTRVSGYLFESALEAGFAASGMHVYVLGPMPTPAIAYLTQELRAQAGVVISASHNVYSDNGIKFFGADGKKLADDLELAIEKMMQQSLSCVPSKLLGKARRLDDAPGRYVQYCKSTVADTMQLNGLKIVLDCAHGATYHVAPSVFSELGADLVMLGDDPDGFNINAGCGSVYPQALQAAVVAQQADLGIAFDGDGDRLIMVDARGQLVDGDAILYVLASHAKMHQHPDCLAGNGCGVVGTLMSNLGLEQALQRQGVPFYRAKVGDRHVVSMMDQYGCYLGGEPSGHIINRAHSMTGDGIVTALQVLAVMVATAQSLQQLASGLVKYPHSLINVPTPKPVRLEHCTDLLPLVAAAEAKLQDRGRVLLRPSGTEACIRVMVEGQDADEVHSCAEQLAEQVAVKMAAAGGVV